MDLIDYKHCFCQFDDDDDYDDDVFTGPLSDTTGIFITLNIMWDIESDNYWKGKESTINEEKMLPADYGKSFLKMKIIEYLEDQKQMFQKKKEYYEYKKKNFEREEEHLKFKKEYHLKKDEYHASFLQDCQKKEILINKMKTLEYNKKCIEDKEQLLKREMKSFKNKEQKNEEKIGQYTRLQERVQKI